MTLNFVPIIGGEAVVTADYKFGVAGVGATVSGVPLGNSDATRRIVVFVFGNRDVGGTNTITGLRINNIDADPVFSQLANLTFGYCFIAHVPNGLTGTIVCDSNFLSTRHSYAVYSMYGKNDDAAFDTNSNGTAGAPITSIARSVDIPAKGVAIAALHGTAAATWPTLDEDDEFSDGGFGLAVCCAHREFADAETSYSVSASFGSTFPLLMVTSWGP